MNKNSLGWNDDDDLIMFGTVPTELHTRVNPRVVPRLLEINVLISTIFLVKRCGTPFCPSSIAVSSTHLRPCGPNRESPYLSDFPCSAYHFLMTLSHFLHSLSFVPLITFLSPSLYLVTFVTLCSFWFILVTSGSREKTMEHAQPSSADKGNRTLVVV